MKNVLITGCSDGGIGHTLAEHFAKAGCHVYATARKVSSMSKLEGLKNVSLSDLDVCNKESIERCFAFIERETGGHLDILVNNAGISYTCASVEMNLDTCKEVFEANVFGVMAMNKQFSSMLIKAKGTIVATGSVTGFIPNPFGGVYHASKAALHMYLDCLRIELEPFEVKVVTLVTGGVQSNISANATPRFDFAENSIYKPMESDVRHRLSVSQSEGTCSREEYATDVVHKILYPSPPARIWKGRFAGSIWLLNTFMPYWVIASIMARRFGITKFVAMLRRK